MNHVKLLISHGKPIEKATNEDCDSHDTVNSIRLKESEFFFSTKANSVLRTNYNERISDALNQLWNVKSLKTANSFIDQNQMNSIMNEVNKWLEGAKNKIAGN